MKTTTIVDGFPLGIRRAFDRTRMPPGSCWNLVDYIPEKLGSSIRKRGGWSYVNTAAAFSGSHRLENCIFSPYDNYFVGIASATGASGSTVAVTFDDSAMSAASFSIFSTFRHMAVLRNVTVLSATTDETPQRVTGGSVASLTGSPPTGHYVTVFNDRVVLANTDANPDRIWFSSAANSQSWDTTDRFIETSDNLRAVFGLARVLLLFGRTTIQKIIGSIPPPGSDMTLSFLTHTNGCPDAFNRSITEYRDTCIWANADGIFRTDGFDIIDLTSRYGIGDFYRDLIPTSPRVTGDMWGDFYVISISSGSVFTDALALDMTGQTIIRLANFNMLGMAKGGLASAAIIDTVAGVNDQYGRIARLGTMLIPSATTACDADGDAVLPSLETPFYVFGSRGTKTLNKVYTTYDLRDPGTANPVLTVSSATSPELETYSALSNSLVETSAISRVRQNVRNTVLGVSFRVSQENASEDTRIIAMEIEEHPREESRI